MDNPVKVEPVKNRRTVVSVSFPSEDFQVVAAAAEEAGVSTSKFIRDAAKAKASPGYADVQASWAGGSPSVAVKVEILRTTSAQTALEPELKLTGEQAHLYMPA